MNLGFVTDLSRGSAGGGSYAVNWHAFGQLQKHFEVDYVGPLIVRVARGEKLASAIRRKIFRQPGRFAYFSSGALKRNAAMVEEALPAACDGILFRSSARWCHCRPRVPYFVYLDAVFHTFFHNTFRSEAFMRSDLERIWSEEAEFLEEASGVFFESKWGMEKAKEAYQLKGRHYVAVGRGGVIEPPVEDTWDGCTLKLLTMAMKFHQKGGDLVLEAYRMLKPRFPGLSWHIIGGPPEGDWQAVGGIHYEGVIRPDEQEGNQRMRRLLAEGFLLVHPTREDTSPLVVTEAGHFGCPSISVNRFALPELVLDGKTGLLLEPPVTAEALAASIESLIMDRPRYLQMRRQAREYAMEHFQWDRIGDRMAQVMRAKVEEARIEKGGRHKFTQIVKELE